MSASPPPIQPRRHFVVAYSYDPAVDSPNEDSSLELKIEEGQIIFVYGDVGEDGYYFAELKGKRGVVPSNMVDEVQTSTLALKFPS